MKMVFHSLLCCTILLCNNFIVQVKIQLGLMDWGIIQDFSGLSDHKSADIHTFLCYLHFRHFTCLSSIGSLDNVAKIKERMKILKQKDYKKSIYIYAYTYVHAYTRHICTHTHTILFEEEEIQRMLRKPLETQGEHVSSERLTKEDPSQYSFLHIGTKRIQINTYWKLSSFCIE